MSLPPPLSRFTQSHSYYFLPEVAPLFCRFSFAKRCGSRAFTIHGGSWTITRMYVHNTRWQLGVHNTWWQLDHHTHVRSQYKVAAGRSQYMVAAGPSRACTFTIQGGSWAFTIHGGSWTIPCMYVHNTRWQLGIHNTWWQLDHPMHVRSQYKVAAGRSQYMVAAGPSHACTFTIQGSSWAFTIHGGSWTIPRMYVHNTRWQLGVHNTWWQLDHPMHVRSQYKVAAGRSQYMVAAGPSHSCTFTIQGGSWAFTIHGGSWTIPCMHVHNTRWQLGVHNTWWQLDHPMHVRSQYVSYDCKFMSLTPYLYESSLPSLSLCRLTSEETLEGPTSWRLPTLRVISQGEGQSADAAGIRPASRVLRETAPRTMILIWRSPVRKIVLINNVYTVQSYVNISHLRIEVIRKY